jgi:hypothetical protein
MLKDAIEYDGSAVAFIQLVAAMDRDGEIARAIRGKRTYRIALEDAGRVNLPEPSAAEQSGSVTPDAANQPAVVIDYDELARALVREFYHFVAVRQPALARTGMSGADAVANPPPRRHAVSPTEHERIVAERDEYARRLEIARGKLDELLGGDNHGDTGRPAATPAAADR